MKHPLGPLLLMFGVALAACEDTVGPPPPPPPSFGDVAGSVSDKFGAPIARASVSLTGDGGTARSDSDSNGQFYISQLSTGTYSLSISRPGFEPFSGTVTVSANSSSQVPVTLAAESLPSAIALSTRVLGMAGNQMSFEVRMAVLGADSRPIVGLAPSSFSVSDFTGVSFQQNAIAEGFSSNIGPYSAVLLMDQSESIVTTDPSNSRLQAGKEFFAALTPPDNAMLAAFASNGALPFAPVTTWGTFSSDGRGFFPTLDQLADLESGGTPLYRSTELMVQHLSSRGPNANKAVVVFTDGDDTAGGASLGGVIALARARNVRVFTVGLSGSVDTKVLSEMALETGGGMIWAADARQLVSAYGSLGNILRGSMRTYTGVWTARRTSGASWSNTQMWSSVTVSAGGMTLRVPIYVRTGSGGGPPGSAHANVTRCVPPKESRDAVCSN